MTARYFEMGITTLVFDFDGTLARQTLDFGVMRRAAVEAIAEHVAVPDRPDLPVMELLACIGTETEATKAACLAALAAVRQVEMNAARESALFPYVRPMMARLQELGLGMGIITRNCREAVDTVFPGVGACCCCLLTRDDVAEVKPHPGHLLQALDLLGCSPEHALMIGDHPMDITVGKRAGTKTAGVATGGHSLEALRACSPDIAQPNGEALMRQLGIF